MAVEAEQQEDVGGLRHATDPDEDDMSVTGNASAAHELLEVLSG